LGATSIHGQPIDSPHRCGQIVSLVGTQLRVFRMVARTGALSISPLLQTRPLRRLELL